MAEHTKTPWEIGDEGSIWATLDDGEQHLVAQVGGGEP
jgi:hypothetical protein